MNMCVTGIDVPILSRCVNDPVIPSLVQVAHRKKFRIEEDRSCGEDPSSFNRQKREGVA